MALISLLSHLLAEVKHDISVCVRARARGCVFGYMCLGICVWVYVFGYVRVCGCMYLWIYVPLCGSVMCGHMTFHSYKTG